MQQYPYLGFGLGLRPKHYDEILQNQFPIDWFEIITEDYLIEGGNHLYYLDQIRERYPVVMHGVSLSIGSIDPVNFDYLQQVKNLANRINPAWISDHFCWTGIKGINAHDLLPLPYNEETLNHTAQKIIQVQEFLGRQILLENASTYVNFKSSDMTEWEFVTTIAQKADCFILLDINNIYVSAFNHGFDPYRYIDAIPIDRVYQFHLAGHSNYGTHIIDTHDHSIVDPVWELYQYAWRRFGKISTLIERDDHIPPLHELVSELNQARQVAQQSESETTV